MDPGGCTKIFLKYHDSAHTCRIEKQFSVFCASSDALSDEKRLTQKVKKKNNFPYLKLASVTSQFVLLTKIQIVVHRACLVNK